MEMRTIDVAGKVDAIRIGKAMAVSEFSRFLGVHENTMRCFLSKNNPRLSNVYDMAEKLGVSVAYLISDGSDDRALHLVYDSNGKQVRPNVTARVKMILRERNQFVSDVTDRIGKATSWWSPTLKQNNPTMKTLARIAHALEVDPVDLVTPVTHEEFGRIMIPKAG